ncbi:MAG TPA: hypothetical protein HA230_03190 [Candidatus Aenigmarchaeota archaeon]|nr:hypothetical protein [Candidatus Aenigmarchaeota archaeon]
MNKKKNIVITQKEHDEWHKKNKGYDEKDVKAHAACHKKMGIIAKK